MNKAGAIIRVALRAYSQRKKNVGTKGKIKTLGGNPENVEIEECDFEDTNEFESDFMDVHVSHAMHKKEQRQAKEILKNQITQRKYFKESSPNFLTFAEKQQIQTLHNNDPEEWTVERLSESFPALPHVINKVLRSKWSPKSPESVIKYDTVVAENWEKFRAGKLALDPQLRTHLSKFKDRKIILTNREEIIEKLIPPKINLPKPQSTLFSSIVKDYVNKNEETHSIEGKSSHEPSLISESVSNLQIGTNQVIDKNRIKSLEFNNNINRKKERNRLSFNDFVKKRLEKIYEGSPEEAITLLDVYRKELEAEASKNAITPNETECVNQSKTSKETFSTKVSECTESNKDGSLDLIQEDLRKNDANGTVNTEIQQNENIFNDRNISNERELLQVTPTSNENVSTNIIHNDVEDNYIKTCAESKLQESNTCDQLRDDYQESGIIQDLRTESSQIADGDMQTLNFFKLMNKIEVPKQDALALPEKNVYVTNKQELGSNELDTHIKAWHKKSEDNVDYTLPIKIPKKIYKEGMTYRVKDCYYDDNGQFLYRVPGLKG